MGTQWGRSLTLHGPGDEFFQIGFVEGVAAAAAGLRDDLVQVGLFVQRAEQVFCGLAEEAAQVVLVWQSEAADVEAEGEAEFF